jgi:F-type H+-transporting ATPase subunit gamma
MKSLAAVNIRQYERAVESLEEYKTVVDQGWQVLLRYGGLGPWKMKSPSTVCMVIGSDQGMCGQFNEALISHALEEFQGLKEKELEVAFWSVGEKVTGALMDMGHKIGEQFSVPGSLHSINEQVQMVIQCIESWRMSHHMAYLYVCHNILTKGGGYDQVFYRLLPLDKDWAESHRHQKWPGRCLPMRGLSHEQMFNHLLFQYLFVSFYNALAQSLASENAARLIAMQAAEKNILEMEEELLALFREQRQASITNELLDIVSGFEALSDETFAV